MKLIFIHLLIYFSLSMMRVPASEVIELDFGLLKDSSFSNQIKGQKIRIKGFLFSLDSNQWILSSEPHLRTCCIGAKDKKNQQIFLIGSFEEIKVGHSVEIEGVFTIDQTDENAFYRLLEPVIVESKKKISGFVLAVLGAFFLIGLGLKILQVKFNP